MLKRGKCAFLTDVYARCQMQVEQLFRTERYRLAHRVRLTLARILIPDATEKDTAARLWGEGERHSQLSVRHLHDGVLFTTAWQVARRIWTNGDRRPTTADVGFVAVVLHAMARGT